MTFLETVQRSPILLSDGGIETRIAYETDIPLDPEMGVSRLVVDVRGREALEAIFLQYLDVGRRHGLPMEVGTPTFRASPERLRRAGLGSPDDLKRVNGEAVRMLSRLRERLGDHGRRVFIAGVVGPRGDAYTPEEAPGTDEAVAYHRAQVEVLAEAGVDLLYAPTFPAADEALGVARAMGESGLPYVLSPIITPRGTLLDGTPLSEVIDRIDREVSPRPAFYTVSCVHPSVFRGALESDDRLRGLSGDRLIGLKANASPKSPDELVSLGRLDSGEPDRFGAEMAGLRTDFGLRVLGGCCGTDHRHIEALADHLRADRTCALDERTLPSGIKHGDETMPRNIPRSGKRARPKTTFKGKRYLCASCRKRSPKPVKEPAPWYCPRCLEAREARMRGGSDPSVTGPSEGDETDPGHRG